MNVITTIFSLIPAIIAAIKAIEEAIPGQGQGEQKLEAVRKMLEIADATTKDIWPKISAIVGVLVGLFNHAGVFRKP